MASNFTDKDTGWKDLVTAFKINAGEQAVFVGWLRSSGWHKQKAGDKGKPLTVAEVARIQEYGAKRGNVNIPERAPLRSAVDEHSKELKAIIKKLTNKILAGKISRTQALGLIGEKMATWIKSKIDENLPPPNAPATIARKGSDHTLIDTAQMRNSVEWEVKGVK